MSDIQVLRYVLLPLALPTMVAGIRTASVWVVGAATIAQPVGATSLGNYIFVGLQTFNFTAILFGCVLSALLALTLDGLLYSLEVAIQKRQRWRLLATGFGGLLLALLPWALQFASFGGNALLAASAIERGEEFQTRAFVIGSKPFTEQYILADLIRSRLREAGVSCKTRDGMGSAFVFNALKQGEVDCYVDYTGTIWTNFMKRNAAQSPMETLVDVSAHLRAEHGLICVGPIGFSNEYVFAMRRADAERLKVTNLSDLAKHSRQLVIGTDVEFFDRPEWTSVRKIYGMEFEKETAIDATLMYGAIDSKQLDVIVAYNTDSRIDRYDLQVIEDPKFALPPYDAILLVNSEMARDSRAMKALRPMVQAINSDLMRKANGKVDVDAEEVSAASQFLLESID